MTEKIIDKKKHLKSVSKVLKRLREAEITGNKFGKLIKNYEEGIEFYKECIEILENAAQKIETLTR